MGLVLPAIIGPGMVMEKHARIWGLCDDSDTVHIEFNGRRYQAAVCDNAWEAWIDSDAVGGPYELRIGDQKLENVYVGYVFMMCGQSNMELPISRVRIRYDAELRHTDNPLIREFYVKKEYDFAGSKALYEGEWKAVSDETIDDFFAVSYFFARKLQTALQAPIGLIDCAAGGSRIEAWMTEDRISDVGFAAEMMQLCRQEGFVNYVENSDAQRIEAWQQRLRDHDLGVREGFEAEAYSHGHWPARPLTRRWAEDIGPVNGSVWFRKTFTLSEAQAGQAGRLFLGRIVHSDHAYINGELVGTTEYQYPPRIYPVRQGLLRPGLNTVAVRVVSPWQEGGFIHGKDYKLEVGGESLNLEGEWSYHLGYEMPPLEPATFFYRHPCGLYNAMLYPVLQYPISAFAWYQGESNTETPHNYSILLERFLTDIRANYGARLPFLAVQLPNFDAGALNDNWQILREQQAEILRHDNTALIITDDIGEDNDLHPINKKDVGERLAAGFLHLLRGDEITGDRVRAGKRA